MNGAAMGLLPRSGEIDADQAYEKLKGLIYRLSHNYHQQHGGDWDEIISEAHWIFLRAIRAYEPGHGTEPITYVYTCIYYGLRGLLHPRGYLREGPHVKRRDVEMQKVVDSPRPSLGERINQLSEEAAAVVRIALFIRGSSPSAKRGHLIKILCEFGWSAEEVLGCFNEIKEAL